MGSRRRFLKRCLARAAGTIATGYVGFRVAAHNGWINVTWNARAYQKGNEPSRAVESQAVNLLVVGDTGEATPERSRVVAAMRNHAKRHPSDAALLLGDNFYDKGVTSVDDPRFKEDFEDLFDAASFPMLFYVALGNHDCGGNVSAQVEYNSRSRRWTMPARYYKRVIRRDDVTVELFVTDTNLLLEDDEAASQQLEWLRKELEQSTATWKIVVGHHPVLTGGRHHAETSSVAALGQILNQCNIDFYLSGHDHDLQLLESGQGWRQIVSGAGSKLRSTAWIDQTVFAKACPGYVSISLGPREAHVSFYATNERLITANYSTSSSKTAANI